MYTLDTNAVIYFLAGDKSATNVIHAALAARSVIYSPSVVRLELLSKPDITQTEYQAIERFLSHCRSIPLDDHIADIASDLRRMYKIKTPDGIIAATALYTQTTLLTRNVTDFKKVSEIRVVKI